MVAQVEELEREMRQFEVRERRALRRALIAATRSCRGWVRTPAVEASVGNVSSVSARRL